MAPNEARFDSIAAVPIFMDVHDGLGDATQRDVQAAHQRDLEVQEKYGVRYLTYWFDDGEGQVFCLVDAPDRDSAVACHKEAHGLIASKMIEVSAPTLGQFMGNWEANVPDQALLDDSEPDTGLRAIMFTDIVGSTDISDHSGDDAAVRAVRRHNDIVRPCVAAAGGREVKHTGDGILASFASITGAVECTMAIQRGFADERSDEPEPELRVKVGMSAGEPVSESSDLYGAAVNLAARVCAHAQPDQILVSSAVRELAIGKSFEFRDRGEIALKGFAEPVRLYEVSW